MTACGIVRGFAFGARLTFLMVLSGAFPPAYGQAQSEPPILLQADGCPSAPRVQQMLAPLLSETVVWVGGAAPAGSSARQVRVRDLGGDYAIELEDTRRLQRDPARDCDERARVAAVFIALNLHAKGAAAANAAAGPKRETLASGAAAPAAQVSPEHDTASRASDLPLHVGIGAFASVSFAPGHDAVAPAGAGSVWLELPRLRFQVSAGFMGKVTLPLSPPAPGGSAELWRVPLSASAGYVWRASRFALEPRLGVAVDVLGMRGRGLGRSERELRANVGADLSLIGRISLGAGLALFAGVNGAWFPRAYALRVEPDPRRAHSPQLWLAGQLGLEFMLR